MALHDDTHVCWNISTRLIIQLQQNNCLHLLLYPPRRGYISFDNTFETPRNNNLGPYVCLCIRPSVHPSACPSVRSKNDCTRTLRATYFKLCKQASIRPIGIENGLYRSTASGASHINQTGILWSWAYEKFDWHQI